MKKENFVVPKIKYSILSYQGFALKSSQTQERWGFEFKHTKAPRLTRSMLIASEDLKLDSLTVIYAGDIKFKLSSSIECWPLEQYLLKNC